MPHNTIMNTERAVGSFLSEARKNKRVWNGLMHTLKRIPAEGIHGECAYELVKCGLTQTDVLHTLDAPAVSRMCTHTTLTSAAARELLQQMTLQERGALFD
jgi:hypothetical protein